MDSGLGSGSVLNTLGTEASYDGNGNLVAVTDPLLRITGYVFDAQDRLHRVVYPDQSQALRTYDQDSHLHVTVDPNGVARTFTCDPLGRVVRVDVDATTAVDPVDGSSYEKYAYGALGWMRLAENSFALCESSYNSLGWPVTDSVTVTTVEAPFLRTLSVQRAFDDTGAPATVTYPDGRQVSFTHNSLGQIVRIDNVAFGVPYPGRGTVNAPIASFEYAGRARSRTLLGNGAQTVEAFDGLHRLIELKHLVAGGANLLTVQQVCDGNGAVRLRNDFTSSSNTGDVFAYDSLYRLTFATPHANVTAFTASAFAPATAPLPDPIPNGQAALDGQVGSLAQPAGTPTWEYDPTGNRTIEHPASGAPVTYSPNALDQYASVGGLARRYDANGNLRTDGTRTFLYDSSNRLVRVSDNVGGEIALFRHDALGRRVLERTSGVPIHLAYDGANVISEYQNGTLLAQTVFDESAGVAVQLATGGDEYWYHLDQNLSVRALTDSNGQPAGSYSFSPFGMTTQSSGPYNRLQFTCCRYDETIGSYDLRARQYDPVTGRFLQRDPLGMRDGSNVYAFTGNNPLGYSDPNGTNRQAAVTAFAPEATPSGGAASPSDPSANPWWRVTEVPFAWSFGDHDLFQPVSRYDTGNALLNVPANLLLGLSNVAAIPFNVTTNFVADVGGLAASGLRRLGASDTDIEAMAFAVSMLGPAEIEGLAIGLRSLPGAIATGIRGVENAVARNTIWRRVGYGTTGGDLVEAANALGRYSPENGWTYTETIRRTFPDIDFIRQSEAGREAVQLKKLDLSGSSVQDAGKLLSRLRTPLNQVARDIAQNGGQGTLNIQYVGQFPSPLQRRAFEQAAELAKSISLERGINVQLKVGPFLLGL
jgi:RHS repeat-associated protein